MQNADGEGIVTTPRPNFRFETARELFEQIPEAEEDLTMAPGDHDVVAYIHLLTQSPTPEEAIACCAYLLPRRYCVWWGHECLGQIDETLDDTDRDMLRLAADWVGSPKEDERYTALDAALEAKSKTPGVWVALGAGWAGGSMVGPDLPPVPPAPYLTARAINAAVLSGLARGDVMQRQEILERFVRMAIRLGEGEV